MTCVYLYGGNGTFAGSSFEWESPQIGDTHNFILFLAQDDDLSQDGLAAREIEKHGFVETRVQAGRPIRVEVLNDPMMNKFQRHYDGALANGCSLVWYPNVAACSV